MSSLTGRSERPETPPVGTGARKRLDVKTLRAELGAKRGAELWRSLEEVARHPDFEAMLAREFPEQLARWADGVDRRRFLQLMGASLAFGGLSACTRQPLEQIVPYVEQPEQIVPGRPLYFATSMDLDGYARALLVESHMGRPTKVEGNPDHPASLGATDLLAQASILDLYDPARSENVRHLGRIRTWQAFQEELGTALRSLRATGGAGLRVLSGTVTSPTLGDLRRQLLRELPRARWHQYDPIGHHGVREGARRAFGEPRSVRYDFSRAAVVVALDSDFLTEGPGAVRYARDFFTRRRVRSADLEATVETNRLYVLESSPTPTGTVADHRLSLSMAEIGEVAVAVAARLGVSGVETPGGGAHAELVDHIVRDLTAHRGESVVVAGPQASPALTTLACAINDALGNLGATVLVGEPIEVDPEDQLASLGELVETMRAGEVETVLVLDRNPVYDAPVDLDFRSAYLQVPRRIHLGPSDNETSEYSQWSLPSTHYLESWGDSRAFDGTVTLRQPLIEPLYGGKSPIEVVSMLTRQGERGGSDLVRGHWERQLRLPDFETRWRRWLHDGAIPRTAVRARSATIDPAATGAAAAELAAVARPDVASLEVQLRADATVHDGRFANNGWLQECPKPITKLTWDNAALVSPTLAEAQGLSNEDLVTLEVDGRRLQLPVWVNPGQAAYTVTVSLGYGRSRVGPVGEGTGFDAYAVRPSASPGGVSGVRLSRAGGRHSLASTQLHHNIDLESREAESRHLVRSASLAAFTEQPAFAQALDHGNGELSLMPGYEYDGHAWGLSVDLSSCTGCNACVVACQAENNVPIVGKEQVLMGREMHWIRIDRYYEGDLDDPAVHHQPVMCMHCEQAPCEVVCPVSATVHSDEGLNDMVYNRCVGTRYCSNNCPYKVRRFNFFQWNDTETPVLQLLRNPDVTVRARGVMEKCSYCVQRINQARNQATREDREIRDGEVQTACQQACPPRAIVFGDVNDPDAAVSRAKREPLDYGILTELGTRPRTTYLAKLRNPNPDLPVGGNGEDGEDDG